VSSRGGCFCENWPETVPQPEIQCVVELNESVLRDREVLAEATMAKEKSERNG